MNTEVCPYCRDQIPAEESAIVCEGCGTRHHADCYAENGGCTIFGCKCAPAEEPKLSVSVPELVSVATTAPAEPSAARATVPPPPPPPLPGRSAPTVAPPTISEMQRITNRVVPSMFGSFEEPDEIPVIVPQTEPVTDPKNRTTFILLGALLGMLGAHNFYAGYTRKGALQLGISVLTLGFGSPMSWVWAVIDICTVGQDSHGVQFQS